MVTPELTEFVRQQIAAGISKDEVAKALASQGWTQADITVALGSGSTISSAVPTSPAASTAPIGAPSANQKHVASTERRFFNTLLDLVFSYVLFIPVLVLLDSVAPSFSITHNLSRVLSWICLFFYYAFFESIWHRTPAKWITKTKVVNLDGTKPGFGSILIRSLCRYIPFEALTFLSGRYPFGWHDSISKTMVVPAEYTVEEAASVNPRDKGKAPLFVGILIGLLLLIPIIGILAGIVLASLGDARAKNQHAMDQLLQQQTVIDQALKDAQNGAAFSSTSQTSPTP